MRRLFTVRPENTDNFVAFRELLHNVLLVRIEKKVNDLRRNPAGHFWDEFQQNLSEMKPIFTSVLSQPKAKSSP